MPSYQLTQTMDRSEWLNRYPRLTQHQVKMVAQSLKEALGENVVIDDPDQLLAYSYDATGERHWPDMAVLPRTTDEVSRALSLAHRYRVPVVGRGASTNLSGGTTPLVGGLVVSFARMNRIVDIDTEKRLVRVEPGVVNAELAEALRQQGYFYPPDPSSHRISTIGGNIAENAGGPHCVKYGVTTHHVRALEVVLGDGRLVNLGEIGATDAGLDIASLVIGSEGTLALVTQAVLAICPLPARTSTVLISFKALKDAVTTVSRIVANRLNPAALELMDKESIRVVESFVHAGYPLDAEAVLLVELDGTGAEVESGIHGLRAISERQGSLSFQVAESEERAQEFWRGRRAHYGATARLAPHLWVQDVTVPRPKLVEMIERVMAIAQEQRLLIVTAAHAGDGNLHPNIPYDPLDPDQIRRLRAADDAILRACVEMGGSITGEHGVGIDKAEHLPLMYSPWELEAMAEVKAAFDPDQVLNPLKALWPAGEISPAPPVSRPIPHLPASTGEVQEIMRWSASQSDPLSIRGSGRRTTGGPPTQRILSLAQLDQVHDLDLDNLSVEVGAGMVAGALSRLLERHDLDLPGIEPFMDDTVGGLVAANAPYWRHSSGHGWRDMVLAAEWVDMRGRLLRFGRKTMKNVAGYDLAKLVVGSRGRIGALTRVTLRLLPREEPLTIAQSAPMPATQALMAANRVLSRPDHPDGILLVRRPSQTNVEVWCVGRLVHRELKTKLAQDLGCTSVVFEDGRDAWLRRETDRLHRVYQAISSGTYRTGRIPVAAEDWLAVFADAVGSAVHLCPDGGWYEMMGPDARNTWPRTSDQELDRLRERVARVFDPEQLLH